MFISNVNSSTEIKVYNITGALVKSLNITDDFSFDLESGIYIAKIKSNKGDKTVKLLAF